MPLFCFLSPVIVSLLGFGLLCLVEKSQHSKPPEDLLSCKPQGFIFGEYHRAFRQSRYFFKGEQTDGHILIVGGAGSGKSSGLAIPSLLAWQDRIFAIDIKGELSAATASKPGQRKIFNPMEQNGWGYDPYYLLRYSDNPAQAAKELAAAIIPEPANVKDPFWVQSAQNLLTAFVLHYQAAGLSFVQTIIEILGRPIDLHVKYVLEVSQGKAAQLYMSQFAALEGKTLAGIFAELSNHIMLFATDEHIKAALSKENTISPEDLEHGIDIFLSIPEDKLDQWKPLFTLITNQFLKHFERRPEKNATPILFLLDEFPRLGKIEAIATGLTTLRSKKITIALIIQSLAQLDYLYGRELRRVILDNCNYKAILGAQDAETQEYFSRLVGTKEATRQGESSSYEPDSGEQRGYTVSQHIIDRRIIQPHEFATLGDVVLLSPWGCYRVGKIKPVVA
jgi:type IV secretion system protein VirD4